MEVLKAGVLHIDEVKLWREEAIQHEGHLSDHWKLQVQVLQRGSRAEDGLAILLLGAALDLCTHTTHTHTNTHKHTHVKLRAAPMENVSTNSPVI